MRADATAGVDPGAEQETEGVGGWRLIHPRDIGQRAEAGAVAAGHHLQPLPHEGTIDAGQGGHVGDGREGYEIKEGHEVGDMTALLLQAAVGFDEEEEDHSGGAEMGQRAVLVLPVRVHHCEGLRQGFEGEVVVEDHHVGPFGGGDGVVTEGAAVDAEDEVVAGGEAGHRGDVRAVAFVDAVGDVEGGFAPEMAEPDQEESRRGAAVDVVVGEDGDPFAGRHGAEEAVGGGGHVAQGEGVGQEVAQRGGEEGGRGLGRDPAGGEDAAEGEGEAGLLRHPLGQPVLRGVGAGPAATGEGGGDVQEGGHAGRGAGKGGVTQGGWGVSTVDGKSGRLESRGWPWVLTGR